MGNKAREINSPVIKQLIDETTPEELAKIDAEMTNNKHQIALEKYLLLFVGISFIIFNTLLQLNLIL
jgi:hypothetical protein